MSLFICAVDTNIRFTKSVYYLKFKGKFIKYVPGYQKGYQDDLFLVCENLNENENYLLITELLSTLSFSMDAKFIARLGWTLEGAHNLVTASNSSARPRKIITDSCRDDFVLVRPLQNEKEVTLARLYRIANSSDDLYLKILFFWHCLCYSVDDNDDNLAVMCLNGLETEIPHEMEVCINTLQHIKENPMLLKDKKQPFELGKYIKEGARHSIAHIKRDLHKNHKSLDIDNLEELRHLNEILDVLKGAVRHKMEHELKMKRPDDQSYLMQIPPEEVGKHI